ncbi:hypothetical protein TVAG_483680 [Trichomonas vaginalis G3]|uniref:receptor protein-tyrosine kinase n=1 Tax=Trichomonas vaginalis (strain ATCC PRA-98 / G3) TaxID=412133 RepID=A2EA12_TRIV3|nr:protein kinase a regulatory subunit binding [Trichomonas vaginalis G3]EAY10458.1 hypothetical protein TVAG_483680 [Trichomonas vaginalis G3]KAI5489314.1 protein kinase a regulatory subunit binding [Trichomonas vaginalis G3]|eukprot:XP_001322681.1 hypothetical protein [Trichomonas vaginalis G3]
MIFSSLFPIFGSAFDFPYRNTRYEQTLEARYYKFEVWGAQGGGKDISNHQNSGYGGKGGYSVGYLNLLDPTTVYVRVGGWSLSGFASGGFNGGGSAFGESTYPGHGGGGGTDIRINEDDIYARVIVAGGGGGAEFNGVNGGYGGGVIFHQELEQ